MLLNYHYKYDKGNEEKSSFKVYVKRALLAEKES